ncbi:MAG: nucleotidyltransferase family protein [Ruminococcus sp.]|nr:nucleotidyltransferase family protein [Ruminococcus sp.]
MLMLLTAIINQTPVQTLRRRVRWEVISDIADYQNVTGLLYLGMLGVEKEISEDCQEVIYQRYRRELLLRQSYKTAEEVIMWQLERYGIDALFLSDTSVSELYPKSEMGYVRQIEILVDKKHLLQIRRLMQDMDYEQKEDRLGNGSIFERVPGIQVVFYDKVPIMNKVFRRYFSEPVKKYLRMENYKFIHILSDEEEYLYRAGRMVELYLTGLLKVREVIDFWQYQKLLDEGFPWKAVRELLEKARWGEFIRQIEILSMLWFEDGAKQQFGLALELEEYIFSHSQENKHLDQMLLPDEKPRLDFYWRNREEEWSERKQEWLFPPKEYMCQFFPVLEKIPSLLVFCWLIRDFRFFRNTVFSKCSKAWFWISVRFLDLKEKMKGGGEDMKEEKEVPEEILITGNNKEKGTLRGEENV